MVDKKAILFVSDMDGAPWGGSEELWSRAALNLAGRGLQVRASVHNWLPRPGRIVQLVEAGVDVQFRRNRYSFLRRVWKKTFAPNSQLSDIEVAKVLTAEKPALVVFCSGGVAPPVEWLEDCAARELPFVIISQSNSEHFWPFDSSAARYRKILPTARRFYFVSNANRRLCEYQFGVELPNAEIVFNPFNVSADANPVWRHIGERSELRLACVARLHPPSKGQDLLLEALADPVWRHRNWRLTLYGDGPMRVSIERLIQRFGLSKNVELSGFVESVENIWADNHVLVLPSRYEGMPLAMVEAMLCARPVLATDVASHAEIVEDGVTGFLADAPTVASLRKALEVLWARRMELESMGKESARFIRGYIPRDPASMFAEKIKTVAGL